MIKKLTLLGIGLLLIGVIGIMATGFNFGDELPYHEKRWDFSGDELKKLFIESRSINLDLKFDPSLDGSGYIEFIGHLEQANYDLLQQATITNGTLHLDFQQKRIDRFFQMQLGSNERQLTVVLPENHLLELLQVNMNSANGSFKHVHADNVDIKTSSGKITITELLANELNVETGSGNIKANNIHAITHAISSSGNITITNISGQGKINSGSGNIEIIQQGTESLDVESSSGNVSITASSQFNGFFDLQSRSGNIKSPESKRQSQDLIKVRSSSGNIRIKES